ncbi:MAG: FxsA family protein, partial [Halanaerobiales bacterium]|nr:FxsA family protein [Halanaerobiales bacterium]
GGQIPAHNLIEGLLILIGGITLLTPGVLTDIIGFLLIIPFSRPFFVKLAKNIFQRYINKNQFKTNGNFSFHSDFSRKDDYVDVEYEEEKEPDDK